MENNRDILVNKNAHVYKESKFYVFLYQKSENIKRTYSIHNSYDQHVDIYATISTT